MKKAVAYIYDIPVDRSNELIDREHQRQEITTHAQNNAMEILAWFEDEFSEDHLLERPGIKALLAFDAHYDVLLVERVWCLGRQWAPLKKFFLRVKEQKHTLVCATHLWDCISQMARSFFSESAASRPGRTGKTNQREVVVRTIQQPMTMRKPKHLYFVDLLPA